MSRSDLFAEINFPPKSIHKVIFIYQTITSVNIFDGRIKSNKPFTKIILL